MSKISNLYLVTIIVILGFIVFGIGLFGSWAGDDNAQIVENKLIYHFSNFPLFFKGSTFESGGNLLSGMFYKPLYVTYFSLILNIFGSHPFPFHLFQLVGHIINSILVFYVLKRFISRSVSFFLVLVFLVHPMQVEAVSYIASSGEVFFVLFGLIALLLVMKKKQTIKTWITIFLCLLASMLFKESGILFVFIVLLYKWLFKRPQIGILACISSLVVGIYALLRFGVSEVKFSEIPLSPIMKLSLSERIIMLPSLVSYYFKTFFFPQNLSYFQIWVSSGFGLNSFYIPVFVVVLLSSFILLGGYFLLKKKSRDFKPFCFFVIWMGVGLGIHLQIIPVEMTVAEHWFYFPMIGLLGAIGIYIQRIPWVYSKGAVCLAIIILSLLSIRSIIRTTNWRSNFVLYSHDITVDPNNYNIETSLGYEYFTQGKLDRAIQLFEQADSHETDALNLANLGAAYMMNGDIDKSQEVLNRALENREFYGVVENMAVLLTTHKDPKIARDFIRKYIRKYPNNAKLLMLLAICEHRLENKDEALRMATKAYLLSPTDQTGYVLNQIQQDQPIELE